MSEIRFEFAKNSEMIFTVDGRHMCSAAQPSREAQHWVERHASKIRGCRSIIVLGSGCGYHLNALKKTYPQMRVLTVEKDKAVRDAVLRVHPLDLTDTDILDSVHRASIGEATCDAYCVLVHEPSAFADPSLLETRDFLLGRSPVGLAWLFGNRGWPSPSRPSSADELLSLKNLDADMDQYRRDQPLLLALRELIA